MKRQRLAAHVHSAWSYDGSWTLDQIAAGFARRGYRAVLMAEHSQTFSQARWEEYRQACAEASRPDLLLVPGIEYADADDVLHLPVWGDVPFFGCEPDPDTLLAAVAETEGFAVLAHPMRRDAWRRVDPAWTARLSGVEFWNRKYDGWAPRSEGLALARSSGAKPFVSLDFHTRRQFFPLAMTMPLDGTQLCVEQVHLALRTGLCRPALWRLPADRFAAGGLGMLSRGAERVRKPAAAVARRIIGSARGAAPAPPGDRRHPTTRP